MMHDPISPPPLSRASLGVIGALFERRTGQRIAAGRLWRLEATLKPVLKDTGIADLDHLARLLVEPGGTRLSDRVVNALLNHETSFFRDAAVLDQVADAAAAMRAEAPGRRLRLWSAGCSTGQEPLSLAMLLDERGLGEDAVDIVATDVSADAVARARAATYSQFEIQRGLPIRRMMTWFEQVDTTWAASRALAQRVQFRQHNLAADAPPPGLFDIVLCRNVLLYFTPEARRAVLQRLAAALRPGGVLVLGAGETVIGQSEAFEASAQWRGFYRLAPRA